MHPEKYPDGPTVLYSRLKKTLSLTKLALAALLVGSTAAQASIVSTATGDGADSYVSGGVNASTNFNDDANSQLVAQKHSSLDHSYKTYLRFDTSGFASPVGSATLKLFVRIDNAIRISVYGLNDGTTGDATSISGGWGESSLTWNNAPANNTSSPDQLTSAATLLGTFDMSDSTDNSSGPYEFPSASLADFVNADTNNRVTLILTASASIGGDGGLWIGFRNKEYTPTSGGQGDEAPRLILLPPPVEIKTNAGDGADSYVNGGTNADTNFNNDSNFQLITQKHDTLGNSYKTYLRFDLSSLTSTANSATLKLHVRIDNAIRISVHGLNNGAGGDAATGSGGWGESSITWNNAPANNTSSSHELTAASTLLGTFDMTDTTDNSSGPYEFSNTALTTFLNDDTNDRVTLILTGSDSIGGDGGRFIGFRNKEYTPSGGAAGDEAPALVVVPDSTGPTYTITASAGANGSISPSGEVTVAEGEDQSFTIAPNSGYQIEDVLVDGGSVGPVTSYTFTAVQANHTIEASFSLITHTITATSGPDGGISPNGEVTVTPGSDQTFTITPDMGFQVDDVTVDGVSVGAVTSYTFSNVQSDHTIHAAFVLSSNVTDVTTADGDGADSYVTGGTDADTNFNSDTNYQLITQKHDTLEDSYKTYLRFDLTGVNKPVDSVEMILQVRIDNAVRISVYGLDDGTSGDAASNNGGWGETSITWNNAPANNTSSTNGVTTAADLLGTFDMIDTTDNSSGPYSFSSFDATAFKTFINNDTNNRATLILTGSDSIGGDGGRFIGFRNKEYTPTGGAQGDEAPLLIFNGPAPEPTPVGDDEPAVSYEVQLTIPTYDPNNSEHFLIDSNADWDQINNTSKRFFFVQPGDYRAKGTIILTADGTSSAERWILLNRTDQTHPYHLTNSDRAWVDRFHFDGADYWVVDRIRLNKMTTVHDDSDNNVLNRLLFWQMSTAAGRTSIDLRYGSDFNTVQNCVIAKTPWTANKDSTGVMCYNADYNRIVKNEIFDIPGDSIQTGQSGQHARGTIIQSNDLYITPAMYTDGSGNPDPNGNTAAAENAIDIKAHWQPATEIAPADKWMIIEYNRMWGFRSTDPAGGGTGSGGNHLVIHYQTSSGIRVRYNKFWDGPMGYGISKNEDLGPISHHDVHHNVFWDLQTSTKLRHIDDSEYYNNIVVACDNWLSMTSTALRNTLNKNVFINTGLASPGSSYASSNDFTPNAYYNSTKHTWTSTSDGSLIYSSASAAQHAALEVQTKRITNPTAITIPNGKATADSPHAAWFGL